MSSAASTQSAKLTWVLRIIVAAGLGIDAVVHLRLASEYQFAFPEGIGGGNLFRIEAALAIVAAICVLVRGSRLTYTLAALVAASAFTAVVLSRYVELPAVGPVPSLYEPLWFFEKSLSAVAEGVAALAAAIALWVSAATTRATHQQTIRN